MTNNRSFSVYGDSTRIIYAFSHLGMLRINIGLTDRNLKCFNVVNFLFIVVGNNERKNANENEQVQQVDIQKSYPLLNISKQFELNVNIDNNKLN